MRELHLYGYQQKSGGVQEEPWMGLLSGAGWRADKGQADGKTGTDKDWPMDAAIYIDGWKHDETGW